MHTGSCHCGAVAFRVDGTIDRVIECNCSHCQRKGMLLWFVPRDALQVEKGDETLSEYRFNKHVIQHLFCPTCGCQPFGRGVGPTGQAMAAINVRCVEDVDLETIERVPFDGRSR
ncbi:GFA family protein [Lysobacter sp. TY2-98]|uniref:GFA family protein n=1 Tax=Lysobacter sp. TY2-98 TaxID=2290922 RepID=UPI000E1FCADB|nr:GFA family protein [Lysobacter sp. TY2-98]AXK73473.1 GFA family protein [Lysobacter sp. TY2-98]